MQQYNSMKIFCYVPKVCVGEGEISSQVRRQLTVALETHVTPVGVPRGTDGIAVDLSDEQHQQVKDIGRALNLAPGRVVGGLLYAMYLAGSSSVSSNEPVLHLDKLRSGQVRCLQEAAPLMRGGRVVLAECGTGSGKGRLIAHAAAYALALRDKALLPQPPAVDLSAKTEGGLPLFIREHAHKALAVHTERMTVLGLKRPRAVLITAPSIENVSHLTREWAAVRPLLDPKRLICTALVLGRAQFVSPSHLALLLEESDSTHPQISDWLNRGMPAGLTPSTAHLKVAEPGLCGLMADLEFLANESDFAHQDAALDEDSGQEEQSLYRELRVKAMDADLVFTTHAMLCLDNMQLTVEGSPGLLPPPAAVLVDEAHMLEPIQASIAAKSLSFVRLVAELRSEDWGLLRKASATKAAIASVKGALEMLKDIPDETPLPIERSDDASAQRAWYAAQPNLKQLIVDLQAVTKGTGNSKHTASSLTVRQQRSIRYVQRAVQSLEGISNGYKGYIGHSPRRGCISFTIGPSSVEKYLAARWATTPTAMLTSGTLVHLGSRGADPSMTQRDLAIPVERAASTSPIHPSWLVESPTLLMPSPEQFHRLMPPTGDSINDLSLSLWLFEVAKVVNLAAQDAKGGMLVLMTGYDRLDGLNKAIREEFPELAERLIIQSRQQRVGSCSSLFKKMARSGVRPIWIATGAAWTGLDLADDTVPDSEASRDLLLTDLLMPNLPFGLDRGTTQMMRIQRFKFGAEAIATQRRLRQGLGRLVRRAGLQHRRIWMLDGRLQHPAAATYTADLRRVLINYVHRVAFEF